MQAAEHEHGSFRMFGPLKTEAQMQAVQEVGLLPAVTGRIDAKVIFSTKKAGLRNLKVNGKAKAFTAPAALQSLRSRVTKKTTMRSDDRCDLSRDRLFRQSFCNEALFVKM